MESIENKIVDDNCPDCGNILYRPKYRYNLTVWCNICNQWKMDSEAIEQSYNERHKKPIRYNASQFT